MLSDAFAGATVVDAATVEEAFDALGDQVPDVVIVDPWKVDPDIGDVVGRLAGRLADPIVVFTERGSSPRRSRRA